MSKASLINDCFLHDKDRLRHQEALDLLKQRLPLIAQSQRQPCNDALGRIVAKPITAPHPVPLHTNSAVDGYAFNHSQFANAAMPLSDRIAAGDLNPSPLKPHSACRIFTGAVIPQGADSVAMQEDCKEINGMVQLPQGLKLGANCRQAGEDLQTGDVIVEAGTRLKAADLAALASIGLSHVPLYNKLKVILFSNGNEMRVPDDQQTPLKPGEVYDANHPLLAALCALLPIELHHGGIIQDTEMAAIDTLQKAAKSYDVILTTGGASRGAEDHMQTALDKIGKRHLWQLAVKPGRPMMFGQIKREQSHDCFFFGLPGNPVAAMVAFLLYTRPALLALAGAHWQEPVRYMVPTCFAIKNKKPDRREFLRGILQHDDQGQLMVDKFKSDGSGLISSLREADGLIEIAEDITTLEKGTLVPFLPFSHFS